MSSLLANKVALVVGASSGIGASIALGMAKEGAELLLLGRSVSGLEDIDDKIRTMGAKSTLIIHDIKEHNKTPSLALEIAERFGRLDIFIGAAAIFGELAPLIHCNPKIWDDVMMTNVTSYFHLLRALDPLLRASAQGKALFLTPSVVTKNISPYYGPYAISKVALEYMIALYAEEVKTSNLQVALVDPGIVRTKMRAETYPGEDPSLLPDPEIIFPFFLDLLTAQKMQQGHCYRFNEHSPSAHKY